MAGAKLGLRDELIKKACSLATKAHKSPEKPYLIEKPRGSSDVIFGFPGSWSINDWFIRNPFGEKLVDLSMFPSLRRIGTDEVATVNEAFLNRFQVILPHVINEVKKVTSDNKQIVFTGHSSGGPIAILVTVWFLQQQYIKQDSSRKIYRCITFGSPLVGDRIFNHALRREDWSQYFTHFVLRYDIVPRVLLAPLSSIGREFCYILHFLNPISTPKQDPIQEAPALFESVMRNASSLASYAACHLMGNTSKLSEILSSFVELSPYRAFGTYIFCTGNRELVEVKNSDAVLQILFYSSQLSSQDGPEIALRSLKDHHNYQSELQGLEAKNVINLDSLERLPLSSDDGGMESVIDTVLNNVGLSTRARLCLCAAREFEKQKLRNQENIEAKKTTIRKGIDALEGYKTRCEARRISYYDAFKISRDPDDFNANVTRLELAGLFDEIMEMIKRYELPDGLEGSKEWIDIGTKYRNIVEPLDIANYYRHSKNEDTGTYMNKGRPKRYRFTQKWLEYAQGMETGSNCQSCFWAEVEDLELCVRTSNQGLPEDVMNRIVTLEKNIESWICRGELGNDIFFEDSTFLKWWKTLPQHHRLRSCISGRIK